MKIFYPRHHNLHNPTKDYSDGFPPFDFMEIDKRLELLLDGLKEADGKCVVEVVEDCIKDEALLELHKREYIAFLDALSNELEDGEEYIPSIFGKSLEKAPIRFQGGMFTREIGTPIQKQTPKAARNSAKTTVKAMECLLNNDERFVFALTRPPGHHAMPAMYGGYSFFNNGVLAAKYAYKLGYRPLILDIDYHIGDGTAEFAKEGWFEYFSLHIDPWRNFPYLDADITFASNVHLWHLPHKTDANRYLATLQEALAKINETNFDVMLLSLGFDILQSDYCQDEFIHIDPHHFEQIASMISTKVDKKILIVLEGGYDLPNLQESAKRFMKGLQL